MDGSKIRINLAVMMSKRNMPLKDLAKKVGITMSNLSILKNGKAKGLRFNTLQSICRELDCQPGDILEYEKDKNN